MSHLDHMKSFLVGSERLATISTLIGRHTTMRGDLSADPNAGNGGIKVDGHVDGSICIPNEGGIVWIGPHGSVTGETIEADYVYVAGNVQANVIARKGIELCGSATVEGQIHYHGSMNMHNLCKLRGAISYQGPQG